MRIYNLDPTLTPEQAAVTFAMTSRSPKEFDVVAQEVSETRAADFHEKWVVGYGHSSVAEHAVLRLAIEGISRLACDAVEENRLASYTEKSQPVPGDRRRGLLDPGGIGLQPVSASGLQVSNGDPIRQLPTGDG